MAEKGASVGKRALSQTPLELAFWSRAEGVKEEGTAFPPLHSFADYGNAVGIEFLLNHGANPDGRNQHGASIHAQDRDGRTPLELAAGCANKRIFQLMGSL